MKSDRDLALSAVEQAFMDSVEHLFRVLQSALTGSAADPAQATAAFEAGLNLTKKTRAAALAGIGKIFP
jgi:hypothetical protein